MNLIRWFVRSLLGETDVMLDHVPVQREAKKDWRDKAVKKARERHGRDFKAHQHVDRVEPPSRDLLELDQASKSPERVILLDDHRAAR